MIDLSIYTEEYFGRRFRPDRQKTFDILAEIICGYVYFESFVDVGCATGDLIVRLVNAGKHGVGVELAPAAFALMAPNVLKQIITADVTNSSLPERLGYFDLAICMEVAEHVPTNKSTALVRNLCQLSDLVLFSAAPPGQGGTGHVNEQPWEFWQQKFAKEGFAEDFILGKVLRQELTRLCARSVYVKNTRVVRSVLRKLRKPRYEKLKREARRGNG